MSDERWLEQAAAYALDALDSADREAFEERLAHDPELQRAVTEFEADLAEVAARLPGAGPPPALKGRVMARAHQARPPTDPSTRRDRPVVSGRSGAGALPWLLLAASVVGLVWVGLQNRDLRTRAGLLSDELAQVRLSLGTAEAQLTRLDSLAQLLSGGDLRFATLTGEAQPTLRLVWNAERGVLLVAASGLAAPVEGRVYQLWGIRGEEAPVSLGTFATDAGGTALVTLEPDVVPDFDVSAITDEPAGGSPQPTTQPFLVGAWRSAQE